GRVALGNQLVDRRHRLAVSESPCRGPPEPGIGAKRMRGHSGNGAAPRERQLCGQEALLVAVLDVRLRLGSSPTTSPPPEVARLYGPDFAASSAVDGFLFDFVGYSRRLRSHTRL